MKHLEQARRSIEAAKFAPITAGGSWRAFLVHALDSLCSHLEEVENAGRNVDEELLAIKD